MFPSIYACAQNFTKYKQDFVLCLVLLKGPVIIYGRGGGHRRENGWVNKILSVGKGGLRKNRPCQRVGKVKIIVCENTKIPLVIFRKMLYKLIYIILSKQQYINNIINKGI